MSQKITRLSIGDKNNVVSSEAELPPLQDEDVRIQVLFSNINKNDLLQLQGKNSNDFFGTEVVGRVIETGKLVGHCKKDQVVGVFFQNINRDQAPGGFANYIQVNQHRVVFIPQSIAPEQGALLMGSGTIAYNAIQKVEPGSEIAVVGRKQLAYLITQFAKKLLNCNVTIFSYEGDKELATSLGGDDYMPVCTQWIGKRTEKYQYVIVADQLREDDAAIIGDLAWRNGTIILAINLGFNPKFNAMNIVTTQKRYTGAKRGECAQAVKALKEAAYHNIRGKVQVVDASKYEEAFKQAKETDLAESIALRY